MHFTKTIFLKKVSFCIFVIYFCLYTTAGEWRLRSPDLLISLTATVWGQRDGKGWAGGRIVEEEGESEQLWGPVSCLLTVVGSGGSEGAGLKLPILLMKLKQGK